jgi:hypothetical protein
MNFRAIQIHSHVARKYHMIYVMHMILHFNSPVRRGFYFPSAETNSVGSWNMKLDKLYFMF